MSACLLHEVRRRNVFKDKNLKFSDVFFCIFPFAKYFSGRAGGGTVEMTPADTKKGKESDEEKVSLQTRRFPALLAAFLLQITVTRFSRKTELNATFKRLRKLLVSFEVFGGG